jgi:hypothetical protein
MPMMRRRPLLRAAAVGGGAYVAGKHAANAAQHEAYQDDQLAYQQQQLAAQPQAAPVAAPPSGGGLSPERLSQLKELGQLHDSGVLTDEEFAQQKQRLLA